jgi:hypothetical protein
VIDVVGTQVDLEVAMTYFLPTAVRYSSMNHGAGRFGLGWIGLGMAGDAMQDLREFPDERAG